MHSLVRCNYFILFAEFFVIIIIIITDFFEINNYFIIIMGFLLFFRFVPAFLVLFWFFPKIFAVTDWNFVFFLLKIHYFSAIFDQIV